MSISVTASTKGLVMRVEFGDECVVLKKNVRRRWDAILEAYQEGRCSKAWMLACRARAREARKDAA